MNKKVLIVAESVAVKVSAILDARDAWDSIDMVIVQDADFEAACKVMKETLPPGKRLVQIHDLVTAESL